MMTPQEVTGATFPKAVMGGYNMASVDAFLDKLTEDYSGLYKENSALKAKMKVLVEKMEEYRKEEDSLRGALLAAQKMAKEIVTEAEGRRDAIMAEAERMEKSLTAEAEKAARARMEELRQEVAAQERRQREVAQATDRLVAGEQERLNQAKKATADFVAACQALCQSQLTMLERLPDLTPEAVVQSAAMPVQETPAPQQEQPAEEAPQEKKAEVSAEQEEPLTELSAGVEEDVMAAIASLTAEIPEEPEQTAAEETWPREDLDATRVIKLDQLQFGRNYNRGDD